MRRRRLPVAHPPDPAARLGSLVRSTPWLLGALRAARDVDPPDWLVGGGALRDLVWDRLHGRPPAPPRDLDLAFFDPARLDPARDDEVEAALAVRLLPGDHLRLVAPCGLDDLFGLVCRRNPRRVTLDHYHRRLRDKAVADRWPRVEIVDG